LTDQDIAAQPEVSGAASRCPDPSVEFLVFAPNRNPFEQWISKDVAKYAQSHGLKTAQLYVSQATRTNLIAYLNCPRLKGSFYNGDANPAMVATHDGVVTAKEFQEQLSGQFGHQVTNIWLACEAYNEPMKSVMLSKLESQKYAAGINDLMVGPSDQTAACAMKAAISGQAMGKSFQDCYKKYDVSKDKWGFGGAGSDYFGR
jgi:hypothetical protein